MDSGVEHIDLGVPDADKTRQDYSCITPRSTTPKHPKATFVMPRNPYDQNPTQSPSKEQRLSNALGHDEGCKLQTAHAHDKRSFAALHFLKPIGGRSKNDRRGPQPDLGLPVTPPSSVRRSSNSSPFAGQTPTHSSSPSYGLSRVPGTHCADGVDDDGCFTFSDDEYEWYGTSSGAKRKRAHNRAPNPLISPSAPTVRDARGRTSSFRTGTGSEYENVRSDMGLQGRSMSTTMTGPTGENVSYSPPTLGESPLELADIMTLLNEMPKKMMESHEQYLPIIRNLVNGHNDLTNRVHVLEQEKRDLAAHVDKTCEQFEAQVNRSIQGLKRKFQETIDAIDDQEAQHIVVPGGPYGGPRDLPRQSSGIKWIPEARRV